MNVRNSIPGEGGGRRLPFFVLSVLLAIVLSGCAAYSGSGLRPGISDTVEVVQVMGEPALAWELPDGGRQLAYPRGPAGFHTYMVFLDRQGRLQRIRNALEPEVFAAVQPGMTQAEVLQLLGPPQPHWTAYYAARDELVWEWRYCNAWNEASRFDVLFDGTALTVRTAYSRTESSFMRGSRSCAR